MRQNHFLSPTLRDVPSDAEVTSHQLMLRAGLIRQTASGVYSFLPLGFRALKKVENIVRQEMDLADAQEVLMPAIQPAELWQESGRWEAYGPELMRFNDRHNREFAMGPTHEEVITTLVRDDVKSYKKLPMTLYQIQTKFRDERRPRFGVLRSREFIMKDAYSFDTNQEGLDISYDKMYEAYTNVFTRCGLDFRAVVADSGAMGGKDTHEFMVLSSIGEDTIAYSDTSNYAANIEIAPVVAHYEKSDEALLGLEKFATPDLKTIDELEASLSISKEKLIKAVLFIVDNKPVLALVRGDHDVNDVKIKHFYNAQVVELASHEQTVQYMRCEPGFIGPIQVSTDVDVLADIAVQTVVNGVCGANEKDMHFKNVNPERDFSVQKFVDLRFIKEGDLSPDGQGTIRFAEGIEVGHVFKLGTRYSEAMGAQFLDENGKTQPMIMGCYGIGVTRTVAAVIEQHHDEKGIVWPKSVAPFDLHLIAVNMKDSEQKELSEQLYKKLMKAGYDILFDDRAERAGVKFTDADLIGLPVRITVGKKASEGIVEVKVRKTGEIIEVQVDQLNSTLAELLSKLA
ncbi:proline--tRNA ligase [Anaerobacillus isosaccharinicus]|uniref:Proline--tRNA ligase n=1 Tax=Anaerobacillus isosaccharinicus TaxID=1532552 RepID=A0A1S2L6Z2_9BACI|nr:proline--tRNA ligase [Anaerobacillus isosaccharinicus]MBA5587298.1 proline--tRNA ligase [Anaerobacillus isosaccharinicus]QOY34509.1 proline--tRNA ligase [Anaerobacillus isosaccharinicus]